MPGNLENRAKTLKGCDFHTLDIVFAGMISRLDLLIDFLQILEVFGFILAIYLETFRA